MNGAIKIKVGPRPLVYGRSKFPYEATIKRMQEIKSTESVHFEFKKEITDGNMQQLRKKVEKQGLGYLAVHRKDGIVYLWIREVHNV